MPIYEYQCPKCGRFDVLQRMSDRPLGTHAACGSRVRKVMSASSFSFKGPGFYATDYGRSARPERCDARKGEACAGCPAGDKAA